MTTVWGNAGSVCQGWKGTGGSWKLVFLRVEKYCFRLDIVIWPSLPVALSFQVGWSIFNFLGEK